MPKKAKAKAKAPKGAKKPSVAKSVARAGVESVPGGRLATAGYDIFSSRKGAKKGAKGFRRRMSAKMRLKKAYERRAMRALRMGNLGLAKKALRQKASVV